jgi:N-carbamoyl-L-amino-acid hydrolase
MLLDVRGVNKSSLDRVQGEISAFVEAIAAGRGIEAEVSLLRGGDPVSLDPELARGALAAAQALGIPAAETWSGAGHDAQHLAALLPTLLVFVPLHGGESHTPAEGADMAEILAAARVLSAALA